MVHFSDGNVVFVLHSVISWQDLSAQVHLHEFVILLFELTDVFKLCGFELWNKVSFSFFVSSYLRLCLVLNV